jgi:hypothetical protein
MSYKNQPKKTYDTNKEIPQFGQTFTGAYPDEMRRQLWPLCCGASIISGFKRAAQLSEEELVKSINSTIDDYIPDMQVYIGEQIKPRLTFLTLNSGQMASKTIMSAIKAAGFVKIGEAKPRGSTQGFFMRDDSATWKAA